MSEAASAGVSVSQSEIEMVTNFLNTNQQMLDLRQQGLVADAVDSSGEITTVTTNERDFGRELVVDSQGRLMLSEVADVGGVWRDPATGFYGVAGERSATYDSRAQAIKAAQEKGVLSLDVVIPDEAGGTRVVTLQKDLDTGVFYNIERPEEAYLTIPQSSEQIGAYRFEDLPPDWISQPEIKSWIGERAGEFIKGVEDIDLSLRLPEPTELDQTSRGFSDIFKGLDWLKESPYQVIGEKFKEAGIGEKLSGFGQRIMEKDRGMRETGLQFGPLSVTPTKFGMPDIKIGDFDVPEFNVPTLKRMASSLGFGGEPKATTPQPVGISQEAQGPTGFLGKVKQFGQNLLGKVGGLFGGQ
jgi:hypothetical protein